MIRAAHLFSLLYLALYLVCLCSVSFDQCYMCLHISHCSFVFVNSQCFIFLIFPDLHCSTIPCNCSLINCLLSSENEKKLKKYFLKIYLNKDGIGQPEFDKDVKYVSTINGMVFSATFNTMSPISTYVYILVIASSVLFKFYFFLNCSINVIGQYILQPHYGINRYDASAPGIFLLNLCTIREHI